MRKKNREINIFSMSALDLFASAMGAFLLIAVIALPYYLKVDPKLIEQVQELKEEVAKITQQLIQSESQRQAAEAQNKQLQQQNQQMQQQNEQLQQQNEQLEQENKKMQGELSQTFCVVSIKWDAQKEQDVDLHIIDPEGKRFYYGAQTFANSSASLTVDSKGVTRGAEVWIDKELKQGTYIIEYVYYSGTGPIVVKGSVLTKSFTEDIPDKTLITPDSSYHHKIAEIVVDSSGQATLHTF